LIARAPILYEGRPVGTVEGGLLLGAEYLAALRAASGVELALADRDGRPIVATGPTDADDRGRSWLTRQVPLAIGPPPQPTIAGFASTAAADGTVRALQWTAGLLGLLGLALAVLLGLVWSSQVSRPVERLAAFSQRVAQGRWDEPLTLHSVRELETLVAALDRMRTDLAGYRDRLVISERQAAWSQMAREIAHEVRNPLTPIAVSVADLKRSYGRADFPEILDQAARTIGDQVESLRRLLQEFSDFGRLPPPQFASVRLADLFADLATLYAREAEAGRLVLDAPGPDLTLEADRGQLRQALVNLVKNGLEALDGAGRVTVAARIQNGALALTVADDGPGLSDEQRARLFVPGFTTKARGSGLGLTIVERIVNDHQGTITAGPGAPRGTVFRIRLPLTRPASAPVAGDPNPEA
jgi:nitrogen fixation/metabolism regulation signal transduction histidine kinase